MKHFKIRHLIVALPLIYSEASFSLGYEKGIVLSGKHAGTANAATSSVAGAEGLIFNPAALGKTENGDFVADLTIAQSSFEAPIGTENKTAESLATPFGLVYSQKVDEKMAWGVGALVTGGLVADHGAVDISPGAFNSFNPNFKSELTIVELTPGISYNINESLSIGAAYRISYAQAEFAYGAYVPSTYQFEVAFKDLEAWDYQGFRVGIQYKSDNWGMGLTYRNEVKFDLEGKADGQFETPATSGNAVAFTPEDNLTVTSRLPQAVQWGGHYKGWEDQVVHFELGFYNYSVNDKLEVDGVMNLGAADVLQDIKTQSNDSTVVRLGYEFLGYELPIRAGFLYVSQVNGKAYASPGGEAPGDGFGYSLGSSYEVGESQMLHFAIDYSYNRADVSESEKITSSAGSYDTTAYSAHLGYQLMF